MSSTDTDIVSAVLLEIVFGQQGGSAIGVSLSNICSSC